MDSITKQTVALIETYYWKYKRVPSDFELEREYLIDTCVTEVLADKQLVAYLAKQGVPVDGSIALSPKQVRWIDTLCAAGDSRPLVVKLKDFKLTLAQHNAWLKNPVFQSALTSRLESILPDERVRVHQALAREASGGNVAAIKLYLNLTGELTEGETSGKSEMAGLMQGILEILESHVPSHILLDVANDFDYLLVHGKVPLRNRAGVVHTETRDLLEIESFDERT